MDLTLQERSKSLIASRKFVVSKNILCTPELPERKPVPTIECQNKLATLIKRWLPDAKLPIVINDWPKKRKEPKEKKKTKDDKILTEELKKRSELALGINSVSRGVRQNVLAAVIMSSDIKPIMLAQHLVHSCDYNSVPVFVMEQFPKLIQKVLGFPCITLGFKKDSIHFKPIIDFIKSCDTSDEKVSEKPIEVMEVSNKIAINLDKSEIILNKKPRKNIPPIIDFTSDTFDELDKNPTEFIVESNKMVTDFDESVIILNEEPTEKTPSEIDFSYVYRSNKYNRSFIPENIKGEEKPKPISTTSEFIEISSSEEISVPILSAISNNLVKKFKAAEPSDGVISLASEESSCIAKDKIKDSTDEEMSLAPDESYLIVKKHKMEETPEGEVVKKKIKMDWVIDKVPEFKYKTTRIMKMHANKSRKISRGSKFKKK